MAGLVFDARALALLDSKNNASRRRLVALVNEAACEGLSIHVPMTVLAQAYFDGKRQAELMRFLTRAYVKRETLDFDVAKRVGEERKRTRHYDVVDQHVAVVAQRGGLTVVTSDSDYDRLNLTVIHV